MQKKTSTIGNIERISLPEFELFNIPAKVDTGAESSAIWASNIQLKNGILTFNFFAPGSMFYREEPVTSTIFRTTTVRSSFGHKEFRYKVKLTVVIGSHSLKRWFTLADRSRNTYPILLGKDLLNGKFVVDVAQKHLLGETTPKKVLVLTKEVDETQKFFKKVSAKNSEPIRYHCTTYDSLIYRLNGFKTRIYDDSGAELADYDFTFFKNHHNHEFAFAAAEYLHFKCRPFADQEFYDSMSSSKLSESMKLVCHDIPVPASICAKPAVLRGMFTELVRDLGLPFVFKDIASDKGKNNYLVQNQQDFDVILSEAPEKLTFMAQKYIDNDGFYRVYVFGKEVRLAIWRSAVPHDNRLKAHLNKPAGGANAISVALNDLPGEVQDLALRAATCLNRQIAGADLVQDKATKKWYILEVNNDPQIRSGSFVSEKVKVVAEYFEKELSL